MLGFQPAEIGLDLFIAQGVAIGFEYIRLSAYWIGFVYSTRRCHCA